MAGLHPEERELFAELWARLPKDQGGTLSPGAAVADVLRQGNLPVDALRTLWALADTSGRGSLTQDEFYLALRYVALCQKDVAGELSPQRLSTFLGMPLAPNLSGDFDPAAAAPAAPAAASPAPAPGGSAGLDWGVALDNAPLTLGGEQPSPTPSARSSVSSVAGSSRSVAGPFTPGASQPSPWAVSAPDRERHAQYFGTQAEPDPQTGEPVLQMGTAIQVLKMSEQPNEVLAAVWDLATFQQTVPGSLTASEFVAAMHILTVLRQQPQLPLPTSLPVELAESAAAEQGLSPAAAEPSVDSPRELASRAEEKARADASARAEETARREAAQRQAEAAEQAAREEEEARRQAEEAILARSRGIAAETMGILDPAPAETDGGDDDGFGNGDPFGSSPMAQRTGSADVFGSESSSSTQPFADDAAAQPRFPSIASNGEAAAPPPTVAAGPSDADLDAAFGPDDETIADDSDPFASPQPAGGQPMGVWPTAAAVAPSALPQADAGRGGMPMPPTSSAPWASPMLAAPAVSEPASRVRMDDEGQRSLSSERLRVADTENLQLHSQIATLSAESSQLQSSTALEAVAAQREAENEELRAQLSRLTQEVAQNTQLYQAKVAAGDEADTAQRTLRDEIEALEIEFHRQKHAIQRQTELNEEDAARQEGLLKVKADLASKVEADKETLEALQAEHKSLLKEVKTMEVNLEYEKMAAGKLSAEVDRLRGKLEEQSQTLRDRKQSYEGHERQVRQLRDERLLLEARATQAASGAASVAAQKRQLEVPLPPGPAGSGQQPASQAVVATAQSEPEDPFGVSDSDSGGSNPFGASTTSEEDEEETGGADAMMFGPTSTASATVGSGGSPFEVNQPYDDPFADHGHAAAATAATSSSVDGASPFDSPATAGPFQETPNARPSRAAAAAAAAGPFSSPAVGIGGGQSGPTYGTAEQSQLQPVAAPAAAAAEDENPFADNDDDPFGEDESGNSSSTDPFAAPAPAPAPAPAVDDNPFAAAANAGSPFGGLPGTGFNPFG